jgi:hypothetical protein
MDASLTAGRPLRPKQTSVLPWRPNLDGGRPADPLVTAFEGVMEGLVATDDDRRAFELASQRLHQIRAQESRLILHLEARALRLHEKITPELSRIADETDRVLCARTEARR